MEAQGYAEVQRYGMRMYMGCCFKYTPFRCCCSSSGCSWLQYMPGTAGPGHLCMYGTGQSVLAASVCLLGLGSGAGCCLLDCIVISRGRRVQRNQCTGQAVRMHEGAGKPSPPRVTHIKQGAISLSYICLSPHTECSWTSAAGIAYYVMQAHA